MATLYVVSMEKFSGKTALCLGVARKLASEGVSVGYIKPLSIALGNLESGDDVDASVMKRSLGLMEPMDILTPVVIDGESLEKILSGKIMDLGARVMDAFRIAAAGKELMVVEGVSGLSQGAMVGLDAVSTVELLNARCLLVVRGCSELCADDLLAAGKAFGGRLLGVVLNAVPRGLVEFVVESLVPYVRQRGVKVYAILPEDKMLMSATVGELVERLGGRVIAGHHHMDELVENVMVGAMSVENALNYFRRKPNKVVITGGDRPDIQLAALETSTRCLILTGNIPPTPLILGRAEEMGVPVLLVEQDTLTAAALVEQVFSEIRFHQEKKINRFSRMLEVHFNYREFRHDLGL